MLGPWLKFPISVIMRRTAAQTMKAQIDEIVVSKCIGMACELTETLATP